jgi:hypothetical protein
MLLRAFESLVCLDSSRESLVKLYSIRLVPETFQYQRIRISHGANNSLNFG